MLGALGYTTVRTAVGLPPVKRIREQCGTWEAYCRQRWHISAKRWHISAKRSYDLMAATTAVVEMSEVSNIPGPTVESQAAQLARVKDPEVQAEVWEQVVPEHSISAGTPRRQPEGHVSRIGRVLGKGDRAPYPGFACTEQPRPMRQPSAWRSQSGKRAAPRDDRDRDERGTEVTPVSRGTRERTGGCRQVKGTSKCGSRRGRGRKQQGRYVRSSDVRSVRGSE